MITHKQLQIMYSYVTNMLFETDIGITYRLFHYSPFDLIFLHELSTTKQTGVYFRIIPRNHNNICVQGWFHIYRIAKIPVEPKFLSQTLLIIMNSKNKFVEVHDQTPPISTLLARAFRSKLQKVERGKTAHARPSHPLFSTPRSGPTATPSWARWSARAAPTTPT